MAIAAGVYKNMNEANKVIHSFYVVRELAIKGKEAQSNSPGPSNTKKVTKTAGGL